MSVVKGVVVSFIVTVWIMAMVRGVIYLIDVISRSEYSDQICIGAGVLCVWVMVYLLLRMACYEDKVE